MNAIKNDNESDVLFIFKGYVLWIIRIDEMKLN